MKVSHRLSIAIPCLFSSSLPLENSSRTVLVIGGVHWLAKQHIDLIIEALQRYTLTFNYLCYIVTMVHNKI